MAYNTAYKRLGIAGSSFLRTDRHYFTSLLPASTYVRMYAATFGERVYAELASSLDRGVRASMLCVCVGGWLGYTVSDRSLL